MSLDAVLQQIPTQVMEMKLLYPERLLLIIPMLIILLIIIVRDFVRVRPFDKISRRKMKTIVYAFRALIFSLLIFALAMPYMEVSEYTKGDQTLNIAIDNSRSFDVFDKAQIARLKERLGEKIPIKETSIAFGSRSAIGEGILSNLGKDKSLLVVTDGNNNYGATLGDVALIAKNLNTTISALELEPLRDEASVKVLGPSEVIEGVPNDFRVIITNPKEYRDNLILTVDGNPITNKYNDPEGVIFTQAFSQGYHEIIARLDLNDYFAENNYYYKTIKTLPKPKILFVSKEASPMLNLLKQVYEVDAVDKIKPELKDYYAVVMNNIHGSMISSGDVSKLSDYLYDGNGLMVIGGYDSFEYSSYDTSVFSTLLPVKSGKAELEAKRDVNVVVLIDVSSGSGNELTDTGALDIEKAQAVYLLQQLRASDNAAFLAFDEVSYILSPLSRMNSKNIEELDSKIKRLIPSEKGGTFLDAALSTATSILSGVKGEKYIILLSDGGDPNYYNKPMDKIYDFAKSNKIKIISVGAGRTNGYFKEIKYVIHIPKMRDMAEKTGGLYIGPKPEETGYTIKQTAEQTKRLNIVLKLKDEKQATEEDLSSLVILNNYHFITEELKPSAAIYGYNSVVPKSNAELLITNSIGNPVLTTWRYSLGRVAVLTTDDGSQWASELLTKVNSPLVTRTVNWAIGNPHRKSDYYIKIDDTTVNRSTNIVVKSEKYPTAEGLAFHKSDENTYEATVSSNSPGFHTLLGAEYAVNYDTELEQVGFNEPEIRSIVQATGGKIFKPDEASQIIDHVISSSKRTLKIEQKWIWPFAFAAIILFLIEIIIRKIVEYRNA